MYEILYKKAKDRLTLDVEICKMVSMYIERIVTA